MGALVPAAAQAHGIGERRMVAVQKPSQRRKGLNVTLLAPKSLGNSLMDICDLLRWCSSLPGTCAGGSTVVTGWEGDGAA